MKREICEHCHSGEHYDVCLQQESENEWTVTTHHEGGHPESTMIAMGYNRPKDKALEEFAKEVADALLDGYTITGDLDLSF